MFNPAEPTVLWQASIFAEADVIHGDPERCDDECRERCAAAREEKDES